MRHLLVEPRRHVVVVFLGAAVLLGHALLTSRAQACACCDGQTYRSLLGWSPDGRRALVFAEGEDACEPKQVVEVWRVGARGPFGCFDLRSANPRARVACASIVPGSEVPYDVRVDPAASGRLGQFPVPPTALPRGSLDVRVRDGRLEVRVSTRAGWVVVAAPEVHVSTAGAAGDPYIDTTMVPSAAVHPSPNGQHYLVLVTNAYTRPGIGHFDTLGVWARAVEGAPAAIPAGGEPATVDAAPPYAEYLGLTGEEARPIRVAARRRNAEGLAEHRRGDYAAAEAEFLLALWTDPSNVLARYNLACALARQGRVAQAFERLVELRDAACEGCRAQLEHARSDEDLAPVRQLEGFARLFERR